MVAGLAVAAAAAALYLPTLDHPFVYDDLWSLSDRRTPAASSTAGEVLLRAARGPVGLGTRPVSNLSFALDAWRAAPDPRPRDYRATNLAIHAANALLVFALLLVAAGTVPGRRDFTDFPATAVGPAFGAALLWALHPVQIESVTYLHQRMTSLAALFYLAAVLLYALGRRCGGAARRGWLAMAALAGGLALGSKELAATLPLAILLYEIALPRRAPGGRARLVRLGVVAAAATAAVAGLYLAAHRPWIEWMYARTGYTPVERLLTQARVAVRGLSLLVFPHPDRLNIDHDVAISRSLLEPGTTLAALAFLTVLLAATVWCLRRDYRLAFFGLGWLALTQLAEATVVPVELFAEHRLYLPAVGLAFVVLEVALAGGRRWRRAALAISVAGAALLAAWTLERNKVWASEVSLWRDAVAKSPAKVRPRNNLARALFLDGETGVALHELERARAIDPDHPRVHYNLGQALLAAGRPEAALAHLTLAADLDPAGFAPQLALGRVLADRGLGAAAEPRLRRALALRPDDAAARYQLGRALELQGRLEEADRHFVAALGAEPELAGRHLESAAALARGEPSRAIRYYRTALAAGPANPPARYLLAALLAGQGELEAARGECERAAREDPGLAAPCRALAGALSE